TCSQILCPARPLVSVPFSVFAFDAALSTILCNVLLVRARYFGRPPAAACRPRAVIGDIKSLGEAFPHHRPARAGREPALKVLDPSFALAISDEGGAQYCHRPRVPRAAA